MLYLYHIRRKCHSNNFKEGYIGVSKNPTRRLKEHKRGSNAHLKYAFAAYDDVEMVLITNGTKAEILRMEVWLRPNKKMGWNCVEGGGLPPTGAGGDNNFYGKKMSKEHKARLLLINTGRPNVYKGSTNRWSEEQKAAIGAAHKGKVISKEHRAAMSKKVEQYSVDGQYIATHNSLSEASKSLGMNIAASIIKVATGRQKTSGGFVWKYAE